jgi:radical SAM protein with 4Fe4S-binding SPASM domain
VEIFNPQAKIIANGDRVVELLEGKNPAPILVEIDPSNACNHGCYFCISSYIHLPESKGLETFNRSIMSRDILLSLCKDLIEMDVRAINWTGGGEPSVNPYLKEAVDMVGKTKVKMGIFTNGTLIDRQDLSNSLLNYMEWIRISIDAGNAETYNSIRRTKKDQNWDKMMSNLSYLLSNNKRNIDIGVGFVVTPDNYSGIIEFANIFKDIPVTYCQFKPEIVNRERGDNQRTIEFWATINPLLNTAKEILGNKFQINGYKLDDLVNDTENFGRTYKKCLSSQLQPCVGADGNVYVCTNHRGYKQYSYGSLYKKSFKDIWNDIAVKKAIMNQIDNVEKFCNCTKLCKPNEANKKVWELYSLYQSSPEYVKSILKTDIQIKHKEFI